MKRLTTSFMLICIFAMSAFAQTELAIGQDLPSNITELKLKDISGKEVTLKDVKKKNGLLIIVTSNTCPYVLEWEDRYNDIAKVAGKNDVGVIFINSNEGLRDSKDSFEAMQKHAKEAGYKGFLYSVDKDHKIADAIGALKTPHVFLFNEKSKLAYRGAIDDNGKDKLKVKVPYLANALNALGADKNIAITATRSIGCGIYHKKN